MRINTNVASLNAMESNTQVNKNLTNALEKLSSGLRINKASDDASGMAISDKLKIQASSLGQSISNGNSAVALLQIADKAMAEQSNILDIVKQKLIQAGTDTTSAAGRTAIAKDISKLLEQLTNIADQTNYNGISLLQKDISTNSSGSALLTFQMGEKSSNIITSSAGVQANAIGLDLVTLTTQVSPTEADDFTSQEARDSMATMDSAIDKLNTWRSDFGSTQNQIESAIRNMATQQTNIKAAESVIRDVDYAQESANFNKQNIISQAGTYALSQANNVQQNVLKLLQ